MDQFHQEANFGTFFKNPKGILSNIFQNPNKFSQTDYTTIITTSRRPEDESERFNHHLLLSECHFRLKNPEKQVTNSESHSARRIEGSIILF